MPKTILYIHQSAELYGSDKTLNYLVGGINLNPEFKTIVILPNDGPLRHLLEKQNVRVIIFPVIKVSRSIFKPNKLIGLPFLIMKTTKKLNKLLSNEKIDIIHSNTLAVLLGAFYAKRYKIKHVWHVHEIIKKPKAVSMVYPILVRALSQKVVFNSRASRDFLCQNNTSLFQKSIVNLNGIDRNTGVTSEIEKQQIRTNVFNFSKDDIVLALVGRISKWKGQKLLLEAFSKIKEANPNLKLVFVGSAPPNQEYLVHELDQSINQLGLNNSCKIIPFQENIWSIWDSIDIGVISSTEPEPFGLVALEAMLAKKPVIAAKHGGLIEIILNDKTGYFFEPNNSDDLASTIQKLIASKSNIATLGLQGYEHAINEFSLQRHVEQFVQIYKDM